MLQIRFLDPPPLKKVTLVTKIIDIDLNQFKYLKNSKNEKVTSCWCLLLSKKCDFGDQDRRYRIKAI